MLSFKKNENRQQICFHSDQVISSDNHTKMFDMKDVALVCWAVIPLISNLNGNVFTLEYYSCAVYDWQAPQCKMYSYKLDSFVHLFVSMRKASIFVSLAPLRLNVKNQNHILNTTNWRKTTRVTHINEYMNLKWVRMDDYYHD